MERAIFLAGLGLGKTKSNPLVGAVVIKNNVIIGEGFHHAFGKPHAEVEALKSLNSEDCSQATLYVTLEPCNHHGKTPPCTDLIIEKGIKKVVVGCLDPHPLVSGKGIEKLKQNGIDVEVGFEEPACREINKRFFSAHEKQRPYIILKWAQSANAIIGTGKVNEPLKGKISNEFTFPYTHRWRSEEQALLVGCNTILNDNPALNVRLWEGNHPVVIILDPNQKIKHSDFRVFENKKPGELFIFSKTNNPQIPADFQRILPEQDYHLNNIMKELIKLNLHSLLVEGGSITLQHFLDLQLWDEIRYFESVDFVEGSIKAPVIKNAALVHTQKISDNTYFHLLPKA